MTAIKRTHTFTVDLSEAMNWFNLKMEHDPWEDVYHSGFTFNASKDINPYIPDELGGEKLTLLFPHIVARALEDADRAALADALDKASLRALEENLLMIDVPGEYTGLDSNDKESFVAIPSCVEKVEIDRPNEKCYITIKNPEHLINDLINGDGFFAPCEILTDQAQDKAVQDRIHFLHHYHSIYGDCVARIPDRLDSFYEDEHLADFIRLELEHYYVYDAAGDIYDLIQKGEDPEEIIKFCCKHFGLPKKDLADAVLSMISENKDEMEKLENKLKKVS